MSAGRRQQGFTLTGALIVVAVLGAEEGELGHAGAYYERTPGAMKRFPEKLEDLLQDKRHPMPQRHLRRLYTDPMTGNRDWGVVSAPEGGIMGVYSLSQTQPIKRGGFLARDSALADSAQYTGWQFVYSPANLVAPAARGEAARAPPAH